MNWRTLNAGSADFAGSFNEQVQVSTTADFSANVVTLAPAARFTGSIAAGGAAERSAEVNLPIGINGPSDVSKVWYLRVVTDISGEVYEYNLENNNASTPSSLVLNRPALPDLVVAAVDAPDAALAGGEVVVTGRIAPPPSRLFAFGSAELGRIRQNVDLEALAREIGVPLRPLSVQQTDLVVTPAGDSAQVGDLLQRQWPAPAADVSKNQGYALQWFALCALIIGLYVWFQLLRPRFARPHG